MSESKLYVFRVYCASPVTPKAFPDTPKASPDTLQSFPDTPKASPESPQRTPRLILGSQTHSQRRCQVRHAQNASKVTCDASQGMIFTRVAFLGDRYLRGLSSQIVNHYDVLGGRFASLRRFEQIFVPHRAHGSGFQAPSHKLFFSKNITK